MKSFPRIWKPSEWIFDVWEILLLKHQGACAQKSRNPKEVILGKDILQRMKKLQNYVYQNLIHDEFVWENYNSKDLMNLILI